MKRRAFLLAGLTVVFVGIPLALARDDDHGSGRQKWVTSWAASAHGTPLEPLWRNPI